MSTFQSIIALSVLTVLGAGTACSSGDPYDLRAGAAPPPSTTGWADPNGGYDAAPAPKPAWPDAGKWDAGGWDASTDADSGWTADTGSWTLDSGPPSATQGNVGSCGNPICAGDGLGDCGCYATDSQGNAVTLGCSGGECGCFVNQQQTDDVVEGAGACDSNSATAQAFIVGCSCE
jgi:hypothetical protein